MKLNTARARESRLTKPPKALLPRAKAVKSAVIYWACSAARELLRVLLEKSSTARFPQRSICRKYHFFPSAR